MPPTYTLSVIVSITHFCSNKEIYNIHNRGKCKTPTLGSQDQIAKEYNARDIEIFVAYQFNISDQNTVIQSRNALVEQ